MFFCSLLPAPFVFSDGGRDATPTAALSEVPFHDHHWNVSFLPRGDVSHQQTHDDATGRRKLDGHCHWTDHDEGRTKADRVIESHSIANGDEDFSITRDTSRPAFRRICGFLIDVQLQGGGRRSCCLRCQSGQQNSKFSCQDRTTGGREATRGEDHMRQMRKTARLVRLRIIT